MCVWVRDFPGKCGKIEEGIEGRTENRLGTQNLFGGQS